MGYTIKDVAKLAGISIATVSRVLNNSGYVKESTRERVMEAVSQLGYAPNIIARSLSRSSSDTIAVIIPDITNPFFSEAIRGITAVLNNTAFSLVFYNTNEDPHMEQRALESLQGRGIAGLIFAPEQENNPATAEHIRKLQSAGIPTVLLDRDLIGVDCDRVLIDNVTGARRATESLLAAGHRYIAIIHGPENTTPGRERLQGWREALCDHGVIPAPELCFPGSFTYESGLEQSRAILADAPGVTAIFSCNNVMTLGCIKALRDAGLLIPDDIALVGFDGLDSTLCGNISHVSRPTVEMGKEAVNILLQRIAARLPDYSLCQNERLIMQTGLVLKGSERFCAKDRDMLVF